jgi:hypothetical protein
VRVGEDTQVVSSGLVPRIEGLFQNQKLYGTDAIINALVPASSSIESVSYKVDDGTELEVAKMAALPGDGPLATTLYFSMGGNDGTGAAKAYSFVAWPDGPHSVTATARYTGGTLAARTVQFTLSSGATGTVSWATDIKPIFDGRCYKCHTTGPGRDLTTYDAWKLNSDLIVTAVRDMRMPADGPLDPALIQKIARWSTGGQLP